MISSPMAVYVAQTNAEDDGNQMPNFWNDVSLLFERDPQRAPNFFLSAWFLSVLCASQATSLINIQTLSHLESSVHL